MMRLLPAALALALAGCEAQPAAPPAQDAEMARRLANERETAERHALMDTMRRHPALVAGGKGPAAGKPINVPTTVPERPAGAEMAHDAHNAHRMAHGQ